MKQDKMIPESIDAYITTYPDDIKEKLTEMRSTIQAAAPDAAEKISWSMPTFTWKGKILVQFAAHKKHIGFYPMPDVIEKFKEELADFKTTKGGIQFPYKNQLPAELITEIVKFRVKEISDKLKK